MQNGHDEHPDVEWITVTLPFYKGELKGYEADKINHVRLDAGNQRLAFHRLYEAYVRIFPPSPVDTNQSRRPAAVKWLFHHLGEALNTPPPSGSKSKGK